MEWDGETWETIDAPLPPEVYDFDFGPMAYYPKAAGIISKISNRATLLYKDRQWNYLLGEDETPYGKILVYYPPLNMVLAFWGDSEDRITVLALSYQREHSRPFAKP